MSVQREGGQPTGTRGKRAFRRPMESRPNRHLPDPELLQARRAMALADLAWHCRSESERFSQGWPHDSSYAYELFRRALVERDQVAWEYLYQQYAALVDHWVRSVGAFPYSGESSEDFVSAAFARFWRAVTPERFASFPSVSALLHYLQRCAGCVVIDSVRARTNTEALAEREAVLCDSGTPPDEEAMARVEREEFWGVIDRQLRGEAERVVVVHSFVLGMKPGDIFRERRDLFASVGEVYAVKRNVLTRLGNSAELRQMVG